jgi:hypothetical protein
MYKPIGEGNATITPFKVYKEYEFTDADSGSGVFTLEATSGSNYNFNIGTAASQSIGTLNELSRSLGYPKDTWYSVGTFYNIPVYNSINHLYYRFESQPDHEWFGKGTIAPPQPQFVFNQDPWPRDSSGTSLNKLLNTARVINVPRKFFGQEIKLGTVEIIDNSTDSAIVLVDDQRGHLYDTAYSESFANRGPYDLAGYWGFNNNALDLARGNHGILQNNPTYSSIAKYGQSLLFTSASKQQVNVGSKVNGSTESGRGLAVSAWVYPSENTGSHMGILYKDKVLHMRIQGGDRKIVAFINNSGLSGSMIDDWQVSGDSGGYISGEAIPTGSWSHVVVQYTNDDTQIKAYIDATEVTYHAKATVAPGKINTNSSDAIIGGGSPRTEGLYMDGYIDEVRVYDRPLSSTEINALYVNAGAQLGEAGVSSSALPDVTTGDCVGNVFYDQGIITITDVGTKYGKVAKLTGVDGFKLTFQGTKTIREYEYLCNVQEYEYNGTDNISATPGRSGSQLLGRDLTAFYREGIFDPLSGSVYNEVGRQEEYDSGSLYKPAGLYSNFITHSEFNPYITSVGLYNDEKELLAVGKLSRPIKKPKEYDISFTVRFDT